MPDYIATLRATFTADNDAEAQLIAELCRVRAEMELDTEEDHDEVIVTQVSSLASEVPPEELIVRFIQARNDLLRTKWKECYDMARYLDQIIHALKRRMDPEEVLDYDHGKFTDVAYRILTRGENPND